MMIVPYVIFGLETCNFIFFNAVFVRQVLGLQGPFTFFGIVGSATAFLSFIWKPIAGRLSDENGSTVVLFWCLFGGLVGTVLSLLSGSLYLLFFARLIASLGSPSQTLLRQIITDLDKENLAKNMSRLGVIGATVGIGSVLLSGHLLELPNGILIVYGVMISNNIISLASAKLLPVPVILKKQEINPSSTKHAFREMTTALKTLKNVSTSEAYYDVFLLKALIGLSFGTIDSNCVLIFNSLGISDKNISYLFTGICAVTILSNIFLIKLNKKYYGNDFGYDRILHACTVLIATCLIEGYTFSLLPYVSALLIMVSARVQVENTIMEILLRKVGDEDKAVILGCFDSIQSLTDLLSPIVASLALEFSGRRCVYLISAFLVTASAGVLFKTKPLVTEQKKKK